MRSLLFDASPLRRPGPFRRLLAGRSVSLFGGQLTVVAVMYQVWETTRSPVWTGSVAVAQAVPMVLVGLWGGGLLDRADRRRILLVATVGQLGCTGVLVLQALWAPSVVVVLAAVAGQAACSALSGPASRAVLPRLLPDSELAAGLAVTRLAGQAAMLAGPVCAGVLLGAGGVRACYLLDAASFGAALLGVVGVPPLPPTGQTARPGLRGVLDGVGFVARDPLVRGVLLADLAATLLAMPVTVFPVLNQERFDGDPRTLGLFWTALAAGGVVASLFAGTFTSRTRPGAGVVVAGAVWGSALVGLGAVSSGACSLGLLALAGAADTVSVVCRGTVVQLATPDGLRGRTSAVEMVVGIAGPDLGNLRAGVVAESTSAGFAVASGGVCSLLALGVVVATSPALLSFRRRGVDTGCHTRS